MNNMNYLEAGNILKHLQIGTSFGIILKLQNTFFQSPDHARQTSHDTVAFFYTAAEQSKPATTQSKKG